MVAEDLVKPCVACGNCHQGDCVVYPRVHPQMLSRIQQFSRALDYLMEQGILFTHTQSQLMSRLYYILRKNPGDDNVILIPRRLPVYHIESYLLRDYKESIRQQNIHFLREYSRLVKSKALVCFFQKEHIEKQTKKRGNSHRGNYHHHHYASCYR